MQTLHLRHFSAARWISLSALTNGAAAPAPLGILSERETTLPNAALAAPAGGWVKLNASQAGLYRVNYTPEQVVGQKGD